MAVDRLDSFRYQRYVVSLLELVANVWRRCHGSSDVSCRRWRKPLIRGCGIMSPIAGNPLVHENKVITTMVIRPLDEPT